MKTELEKIRHKIDVIDDRIFALLEDRFLFIKKVAEYKKKNNIKILDKAREQEIYNRIGSSVSDDLKPSIKKIFSTIIKESKAQQK